MILRSFTSNLQFSRLCCIRYAGSRSQQAAHVVNIVQIDWLLNLVPEANLRFVSEKFKFLQRNRAFLRKEFYPKGEEKKYFSR